MGNKSDLTGSRVVTFEKGEKFARDHRMHFFETRYDILTFNHWAPGDDHPSRIDCTMMTVDCMMMTVDND